MQSSDNIVQWLHMFPVVYPVSSDCVIILKQDTTRQVELHLKKH